MVAQGVSVSTVLASAGDFVGGEVDHELTDKDLTAQLSEFGVDRSDSETRENKLKCLALVSSPDFWRSKYDIHPNKKRVKNWLWVHDRYRKYLRDILTASGSIKGNIDTPAKLKGSVIKLQKDFNKFARKIADHSEFEDNQLFKYFKDHAGDGWEGQLCELYAEHADEEKKSRVDVAFKGALAGASGGGNCEEAVGDVEIAVKAYCDWMMDHLMHEERVLVFRWLNLSDAGYKKFRSYISWKCAMMY